MAPPNPSPQVIGTCAHCRQELYSGSPVAKPTVVELAAGADADLAHVACAVYALRDY